MFRGTEFPTSIVCRGSFHGRYAQAINVHSFLSKIISLALAIKSTSSFLALFGKFGYLAHFEFCLVSWPLRQFHDLG